MVSIENNLKDISDLFRKKGLDRQATLLESPQGYAYLNALLKYQWDDHMREVLGQDVYKKLISCSPKSTEERFLERVVDDDFKPRSHNVAPLEVILTIKPITNEDITLTEEKKKEINKLSWEAKKIIYDEVIKQSKDNDNLIFEIYKDKDPVSSLNNKDYYNHHKNEYIKKLTDRVKLTKNLVELNAPYQILEGLVKRILDVLPGFEFEKSEDVTKNAANLVGAVSNLLDDKPRLEISFDVYVNYLKGTFEKRVVAEGKDNIDREKEMADSTLENDKYSYNSLETMLEVEGIKIKEDIVTTFLSSPLNLRNSYLDDLDSGLFADRNLLIGLQQIISGGPITNPNASNVSVLQNHDSLPNIKYSEETLSRLSEIASRFSEIIDSFPELSGLATPSKLKKKSSLTYSTRELDKNPLDVTFGNESGCCLIAPEKLEDLANGFTIPYFLDDNNVRLFGTYRLDKAKEQRMGLIVGFESFIEGNPNAEILVCNSVELSRLGIAGGKSTIEKISKYDEEWIKSYAQANGYSGVTMGNHSYNTSVNYSSHKADVVKERLVFRGRNNRFYSDVFARFKDGKMKTRKNSVYWLWKK